VRLDEHLWNTERAPLYPLERPRLILAVGVDDDKTSSALDDFRSGFEPCAAAELPIEDVTVPRELIDVPAGARLTTNASLR
jgi:hypothetical protein